MTFYYSPSYPIIPIEPVYEYEKEEVLDIALRHLCSQTSHDSFVFLSRPRYNPSKGVYLDFTIFDRHYHWANTLANTLYTENQHKHHRAMWASLQAFSKAAPSRLARSLPPDAEKARDAFRRLCLSFVWDKVSKRFADPNAGMPELDTSLYGPPNHPLTYMTKLTRAISAVLNLPSDVPGKLRRPSSDAVWDALYKALLYVPICVGKAVFFGLSYDGFVVKCRIQETASESFTDAVELLLHEAGKTAGRVFLENDFYVTYPGFCPRAPVAVEDEMKDVHEIVLEKMEEDMPVHEIWVHNNHEDTTPTFIIPQIPATPWEDWTDDVIQQKWELHISCRERKQAEERVRVTEMELVRVVEEVGKWIEKGRSGRGKHGCRWAL